jgi:glucosamine kinase
VLTHADAGDPTAIAIVQDAAAAVDRLILALNDAGIKRIALLGGMADGLTPWLNAKARARLTEPEGTALDGALLLARKLLSTRARPSDGDMT